MCVVPLGGDGGAKRLVAVLGLGTGGQQEGNGTGTGADDGGGGGGDDDDDAEVDRNGESLGGWKAEHMVLGTEPVKMRGLQTCRSRPKSHPQTGWRRGNRGERQQGADCRRRRRTGR